MFTKTKFFAISVLTIFILGLLLRSLYPLNRQFEFDQDQIAQFSYQIAHGKFTLIGPRTGPIQFFTGPLIYYLGAFVYFLTNFHPIANTFLSLVIYSCTFGLIFWLLRHRFNQSLFLIFLSLYSLSPYLVELDRITWNPNLCFSSAFLVLLSLLLYNRQRPKLSYLTGIVGLFLAYQAHFSGFIISGLALILCLFYYRSLKLTLSLALGLGISLIPLLLFDLRHQWLNLQGLFQALNNSDQFAPVNLLFRLSHNFSISLENVSKIFILGLPYITLLFIGIGIIGIWIFHDKKSYNRSQVIILLSWIIFLPIVLAWYRGPAPEYYFLMQLPALIFILSDLLSNYLRSTRSILLFSALLFSLALGRVYQQHSTDLTLKTKLQALNVVKAEVKDQEIDLVFDMDINAKLGWNYLIQYLDLHQQSDSSIKVHLMHPITPTTIASARFGSLGVWFDQRGLINQQSYLDSNQGVLFYYPSGWRVSSMLEALFYPNDSDIKILGFANDPNVLSDQLYYFYFPIDTFSKYLSTDSLSLEKQIWPKAIMLNKDFSDFNVYFYNTPMKTTFGFIFPAFFTQADITSFLSLVETI